MNWSTVPRCVTEPSDTEKYLLKTGDIVVSRAGSVGCCALLGEVPPSVFASYLIRLRPLAPLNKTYVFWFLQSPAYWDAISEASVGIAVQNVNAKKLASIELPIPPLAEQGRIVEILDEHLGRLDTALEHIKIAREKAAQFRRSLLHAAFTGALTGHNPTTNQLPDGWRVENLGDLVQFAPKVRPELLEQDAELSFVPMKAVAEISGEVALDEAISATAAKKKNLTYFEDGDVIFAKITPCMENGKIARPTGLLNGSAYGSTSFMFSGPARSLMESSCVCSLSMTTFGTKPREQ